MIATSRRVRSVILVIVLLTAISFAVVWRGGPAPVHRQVESVPTPLYRIGEMVFAYFGFDELRSSMARSYSRSFLHDLDAAAEVGLVVQRISFAKNDLVDYPGISLVLRNWGQTNDVDYILPRHGASGLLLYVSTDDVDKVQHYLSSLSFDEWTPFE